MIKFVPWVIILLLLMTAAWLWRERENAKAEAARAQEAVTLAAKGQIVERPVEQDMLENEIASLEVENLDLRVAIQKAKQAAPDAKVTQVEHAQIAPTIVTAAPEVATPSTRCVVSDGDKLELKIDQVELQTKAGNIVLVGSASAWRTDPPPAEQLVTGKFEQSTTTISGIDTIPKKLPGWGYGVAGFVGNKGWAPGLTVSAPPLTIFGYEFDVNLAAGIGTLGVIGSASILMRP